MNIRHDSDEEKRGGRGLRLMRPQLMLAMGEERERRGGSREGEERERGLIFGDFTFSSGN